MASAKHEFLRTAHRLILPVSTAHPATRAAHAFFKLRAYPFDMLLPRLRPFYGNGPTDPFIARERRNVFPRRQSLRVGCQGFSQICGQVVRHAAGNFFGHISNLYLDKRSIIPLSLIAFLSTSNDTVLSSLSMSLLRMTGFSFLSNLAAAASSIKYSTSSISITAFVRFFSFSFFSFGWFQHNQITIIDITSQNSNDDRQQHTQ